MGWVNLGQVPSHGTPEAQRDEGQPSAAAAGPEDVAISRPATPDARAGLILDQVVVSHGDRRGRVMLEAGQGATAAGLHRRGAHGQPRFSKARAAGGMVRLEV
jgi:hypothetical protein